MAGHMIYYYLLSLKRYNLSTVCFRNKISEDSIILDVYNVDSLRSIIRTIEPDYVINCIGVLVNSSKKSPEHAIYINAYFPHILTRLINESNPGGYLIHISTDCVFSGNKGMYSDTCIKDALDIYGMTKNLGEIIDDKNLTIRTSIIGPELKENGEGLFYWIFTQRERRTILGYEKSLWGGVTTLELAKAVAQCIEHHVTGLFQLTNGEKISKYELVQLVVKQFKLKIEVQRTGGIAADKSMLPSARNDFTFIVSPYTAMLEELYHFMYQYQQRYIYYFY